MTSSSHCWLLRTVANTRKFYWILLVCCCCCCTVWQPQTVFTSAAAAISEADEQFLAAAFANDVDALKRVIASAHVNAQDPQSGQTAFMGAVLRGHLDVIRYLMTRKDVDGTIAEKDGYTPAHGAGFQGRAEIMELLFHSGINVHDDYHADGHAPLHRACWGRTPRHTETIKVLRDVAGVDIVHLTGGDGKTCAEMTKNPDTLQLLRETAAKLKNEKQEL